MFAADGPHEVFSTKFAPWEWGVAADSTGDEQSMGVKKSGKGRRKLGQKKRRMRAKIRHRKR